jgi:peptidoglycan/xylan/chitin deacetylase (PgdA/CDA1 family)
MTRIAMPEKIASLEAQGVPIKVVDYSNLLAHTQEIRQALDAYQTDFVLFSRNDQVFEKDNIGPLIRELRVGYSTFSGIDDDEVVRQTAMCLNDYLAGGTCLALPDRTHYPDYHPPGTTTFSLIFDMEQLGGVRFGFPRILSVLDSYRARATFFTTNVVQDVYHNLSAVVHRHGHEIGLHGLYHEYLSGLSFERQTAAIAHMKHGFYEASPIHGANFIFRKDTTTIDAMIANDLHYFVVFMQHTYTPCRFQAMPVKPMLVTVPRGQMWMVPVSVETYNRPWFAVRNMIESALLQAQAEGWNHINILLHPFRDGHGAHLLNMERLLHYMCNERGYRCITVADSVRALPVTSPSHFISYRLEEESERVSSSARPCWRAWWHAPSLYQQRIGALYHTLANAGLHPTLCLDTPPQGVPSYSVYPYGLESLHEQHNYPCDPLLLRYETTELADTLHRIQKHQSLTFVPEGYIADIRTAKRVRAPHYPHDYRQMLPEIGLRLVYRLGPDREIF